MTTWSSKLRAVRHERCMAGETDSPRGAQRSTEEIGITRHPGRMRSGATSFEEPWEVREAERARRVYRKRSVAMLRRYMRFSIETGRLPSLLGREFFRSKVTSYGVGTFEDRVIFVHDMETCLDRLDEFSRQLIARHILQEHDQDATARLLHCSGQDGANLCADCTGLTK